MAASTRSARLSKIFPGPPLLYVCGREREGGRHGDGDTGENKIKGLTFYAACLQVLGWILCCRVTWPLHVRRLSYLLYVTPSGDSGIEGLRHGATEEAKVKDKDKRRIDTQRPPPPHLRC
ncbi:hypothetical protein DER46DRAFT_575798 [Fusarium sp. MPI-SDFR-AT-0072]|nr:hypothetical protein DER46DRAFT_575798 [Fusarium sp. MPI-SDFR-AT-0072]